MELFFQIFESWSKFNLFSIEAEDIENFILFEVLDVRQPSRLMIFLNNFFF